MESFVSSVRVSGSDNVQCDTFINAPECILSVRAVVFLSPPLPPLSA